MVEAPLKVAGLLALVVALAIVPVSQGSNKVLPVHGVLTPGISLAGVHVGDTVKQVQNAWGSNYKVCGDCKTTTWYYF